MKCPKCGRENPDKDRETCIYCGTVLYDKDDGRQPDFLYQIFEGLFFKGQSSQISIIITALLEIAVGALVVFIGWILGNAGLTKTPALLILIGFILAVHAIYCFLKYETQYVVLKKNPGVSFRRLKVTTNTIGALIAGTLIAISAAINKGDVAEYMGMLGIGLLIAIVISTIKALFFKSVSKNEITNVDL